MPILATSFAFVFASRYVRQIQNLMVEQIKDKNFENLPITHHLSAGFKAYMSDESMAMLEILRQSCGGAGFLKSSGFYQIYDKLMPFPTFEGVNVILFHQNAKLMLKQAKAALKSKPLHPLFAHFADLKTIHTKKTQAKTFSDFQNLEILNDALKTNSLFIIQALLMSFSKSKASHMELENELFGNLQQRATRNHTAYMIFQLFRKEIEETKLSAPIKEHLT